MIHTGDCLDVMATMEPESVDAIVTDPPYGIGFMGKEWDDLATAPNEARWNKRERNLDVDVAPNAGGGDFGRSGVSFAEPNPRCGKCGKVRNGTPKYVCQCGDDWSPAPRENRQAQRSQAWHQQWAEAAYRVAKPSAYLLAFGGTRTVHRMTVALEDAGWIIRDMLVWGYASGFPKSKASLKPAWEPIVMARKPGPLRMLAIDECRIPAENGLQRPERRGLGVTGGWASYSQEPGSYGSPDGIGRWPANIVLTDPIFDGGIEGVVGGGEAGGGYGVRGRNALGVINDDGWEPSDEGGLVGYGDSGTYSRFFILPKADRSDREPVLGGLPLAKFGGEGHALRGERAGVDRDNRARANVHPTVKPTDLMRHLVRLVTPTGGTVLDPFLGSGSTGIAAEMEGFAWIGIEREAEYVAIAEARLNGTQRGLGLDVGA